MDRGIPISKKSPNLFRQKPKSCPLQTSWFY